MGHLWLPCLLLGALVRTEGAPDIPAWYAEEHSSPSVPLHASLPGVDTRAPTREDELAESIYSSISRSEARFDDAFARSEVTAAPLLPGGPDGRLQGVPRRRRMWVSEPDYARNAAVAVATRSLSASPVLQHSAVPKQGDTPARSASRTPKSGSNAGGNGIKTTKSANAAGEAIAKGVETVALPEDYFAINVANGGRRASDCSLELSMGYDGPILLPCAASADGRGWDVLSQPPEGPSQACTAAVQSVAYGFFAAGPASAPASSTPSGGPSGPGISADKGANVTTVLAALLQGATRSISLDLTSPSYSSTNTALPRRRSVFFSPTVMAGWQAVWVSAFVSAILRLDNGAATSGSSSSNEPIPMVFVRPLGFLRLPAKEQCLQTLPPPMVDVWSHAALTGLSGVNPLLGSGSASSNVGLVGAPSSLVAAGVAYVNISFPLASADIIRNSEGKDTKGGSGKATSLASRGTRIYYRIRTIAMAFQSSSLRLDPDDWTEVSYEQWMQLRAPIPIRRCGTVAIEAYATRVGFVRSTAASVTVQFVTAQGNNNETRCVNVVPLPAETEYDTGPWGSLALVGGARSPECKTVVRLRLVDLSPVARAVRAFRVVLSTPDGSAPMLGSISESTVQVANLADTYLSLGFADTALDSFAPGSQIGLQLYYRQGPTSTTWVMSGDPVFVPQSCLPKSDKPIILLSKAESQFGGNTRDVWVLSVSYPGPPEHSSGVIIVTLDESDPRSSETATWVPVGQQPWSMLLRGAGCLRVQAALMLPDKVVSDVASEIVCTFSSGTVSSFVVDPSFLASRTNATNSGPRPLTCWPSDCGTHYIPGNDDLSARPRQAGGGLICFNGRLSREAVCPQRACTGLYQKTRTTWSTYLQQPSVICPAAFREAGPSEENQSLLDSDSITSKAFADMRKSLSCDGGACFLDTIFSWPMGSAVNISDSPSLLLPYTGILHGTATDKLGAALKITSAPSKFGPCAVAFEITFDNPNIHPSAARIFFVTQSLLTSGDTSANALSRELQGTGVPFQATLRIPNGCSVRIIAQNLSNYQPLMDFGVSRRTASGETIFLTRATWAPESCVQPSLSPTPTPTLTASASISSSASASAAPDTSGLIVETVTAPLATIIAGPGDSGTNGRRRNLVTINTLRPWDDQQKCMENETRYRCAFSALERRQLYANYTSGKPLVLCSNAVYKCTDGSPRAMTILRDGDLCAWTDGNIVAYSQRGAACRPVSAATAFGNGYPTPSPDASLSRIAAFLAPSSSRCLERADGIHCGMSAVEAADRILRTDLGLKNSPCTQSVYSCLAGKELPSEPVPTGSRCLEVDGYGTIVSDFTPACFLGSNAGAAGTNYDGCSDEAAISCANTGSIWNMCSDGYYVCNGRKRSTARSAPIGTKCLNSSAAFGSALSDAGRTDFLVDVSDARCRPAGASCNAGENSLKCLGQCSTSYYRCQDGIPTAEMLTDRGTMCINGIIIQDNDDICGAQQAQSPRSGSDTSVTFALQVDGLSFATLLQVRTQVGIRYAVAAKLSDHFRQPVSARNIRIVLPSQPLFSLDASLGARQLVGEADQAMLPSLAPDFPPLGPGSAAFNITYVAASDLPGVTFPVLSQAVVQMFSNAPSDGLLPFSDYLAAEGLIAVAALVYTPEVLSPSLGPSGGASPPERTGLSRSALGAIIATIGFAALLALLTGFVAARRAQHRRAVNEFQRRESVFRGRSTGHSAPPSASAHAPRASQMNPNMVYLEPLQSASDVAASTIGHDRGASLEARRSSVVPLQVRTDLVRDREVSRRTLLVGAPVDAATIMASTIRRTLGSGLSQIKEIPSEEREACDQEGAETRDHSPALRPSTLERRPSQSRSSASGIGAFIERIIDSDPVLMSFRTASGHSLSLSQSFKSDAPIESSRSRSSPSHGSRVRNGSRSILFSADVLHEHQGSDHEQVGTMDGTRLGNSPRVTDGQRRSISAPPLKQKLYVSSESEADGSDGANEVPFSVPADRSHYQAHQQTTSLLLSTSPETIKEMNVNEGEQPRMTILSARDGRVSSIGGLLAPFQSPPGDTSLGAFARFRSASPVETNSCSASRKSSNASNFPHGSLKQQHKRHGQASATIDFDETYIDHAAFS